MRTYILTERDKQIMKKFIEEGITIDGFRDLKWRVSNLSIDSLKSEIELIEAFKSKIQKIIA